MLVSKPTHGGGAPLGIDLEAGIAKIKISRPAPAAPAEDPPTEPEQAATQAAEPVENRPDQT